MNDFPNNNGLKVFYTMVLYNLNNYQEAMELLLKTLTETTCDTNILDYKEAILFYVDKLEDTW